jgi:hypothetical protein
LKGDAISKGINTDNWEIVQEDFEHLSTLVGPFTVDLFATRDNAKCSRFYARTFEEGVLGVDFFAQSWAGKCAYAAPPVALVMRTIQKAAAENMAGALIIPLWKNARFRTFAFRDGTHLNEMFESLQIVRMHTRAWEFSRRDAIGGKTIQFLVLRMCFGQGIRALESLPGKGRCFKRLFGRDCSVCMALPSV